MLFIMNVFLVEMIQIDLLLAVRCAQELEEVFLELVAVVVDVFLRVFADEEHLSDMRLGLCVHLEAILVAHLALADLGVVSRGAKLDDEGDGQTWQYHRKRCSPLDLSLLLRCFVDPTSAFGILAVFL